MSMSTAEFLSIIAGLAGALTGISALIKARGEHRKVRVESNHTAVDTAGDALALIRQVHEERISALEESSRNCHTERESNRKMIVELHQQLGEFRRAAEEQSTMIHLLNGRIDCLMRVLRENNIPLPDWAGGC